MILGNILILMRQRLLAGMRGRNDAIEALNEWARIIDVDSLALTLQLCEILGEK